MSKQCKLPKVSILLFTYNQEKYIEKTIEGLCNQDYENFEVILSDDCSHDRTFSIACSLLDKNKLPYTANKNEINLGISGNFNKACSLASGEIFVAAAGDDISLSSRISNTVKVLTQFPDVSFVSFNDELIDHNGDIIPTNKHQSNDITCGLEQFIRGSKYRANGASRAFRREVYDVFGDLNSDCPTEDTPYFLRCLMLGKGFFSSEPGILYRKHETNASKIENTINMDIKAIERQYNRDVDLALANGLISIKEKKFILSWVVYIRKMKKLNFKISSISKMIIIISLLISNRIFQNKLIRKFSNK